MESTHPFKNDFQYSLDFLKRFNALVYEGKPLSHQKIFDTYNVWIFFQNRIFFNELRQFVKHKKTPERLRISPIIKIQNFFLAFFALVISVVSVLFGVIIKKRFLVYSIDRINSKVYSNDSRIDYIYQYLKDARESFVESLHTTLDASLVKRFITRRRFVIYIKSIDTLYRVAIFLRIVRPKRITTDGIDVSAFSFEEREYIKWLLPRYLEAVELVIFKVKVLRKVVAWLGVEALLTIDNTRDYWEVLLACKMNGVDTHAFQHGHFTKYHVGWLNDGSFDGEIVCPDKLYVWSDFWKQELLRLGTYFKPAAIVVGGLKNFSQDSGKKSDHSVINVLIPYETDTDRRVIKEYVDAMLGCETIHVLFKARTDIEMQKQLDEYGFTANYHRKFTIVNDITSVIKDVDVVVGTYSTFLYDMIAYEKPVALFETSSDFGEGLLTHALADSIGFKNLCSDIKKVAATHSDVLKQRKHTLFGKNPSLMYDTVQKICLKK